MIIADVVQAVASGAMPGGERWANVMHFRTADGAWTQQELDNLNTRIATFYVAVRAYWDNLTTLESVTLRSLATANAPALEYSHNMAGTMAGDPCPNDIAMVVSLRTAFAGRSYRGRIYLGGFGLSSLAADAGTGGATGFSSAAVEAIATAADDLMSTADQTRGVVASRTLSAAQGVTSLYIDRKCDTQRRRDKNTSFPRTTRVVT